MIQVRHDLTKLNKFVASMTSNYAVRIGVFAGKTARKDDSAVDNAFIGLTHELGSFSRKIPIRSWLTMPLRVSQREIIREASYGMVDLMAAGKMDRVLTEFGFACEDAIQQAFNTGGFGTWKQLSPATVDRKKSTAILIDTAQLRRSVASEVVRR